MFFVQRSQHTAGFREEEEEEEEGGGGPSTHEDLDAAADLSPFSKDEEEESPSSL